MLADPAGCARLHQHTRQRLEDAVSALQAIEDLIGDSGLPGRSLGIVQAHHMACLIRLVRQELESTLPH